MSVTLITAVRLEPPAVFDRRYPAEVEVSEYSLHRLYARIS
jgi:hypothetical protein